jgi:thiamine monophosphate kinase
MPAFFVRAISLPTATPSVHVSSIEQGIEQTSKCQQCQ